MAERFSARDGAVWLLTQVLVEKRLLSDVLASAQHRRLVPAERARAQRLTLATLRGLERADRVLKPYLRKPPPETVQVVLRLACVELCLGGDAHGVVNDAVDRVRRGKRTAQFSGLVNAVLRKVAAEGPKKWAELRVPHLAKWLRSPLVEAYGAKVVEAMEAAHFAGAPVDLTVKSDPAGWAARLGGAVLPTGSVRLSDAGQVSALDGYDTGDWWVQDVAAALPVQGLGNVTGLRVLDMCAAPGGKTMQLAAGGARVTALDLSEARLGRVRENLQRTGLAAEIVAADALAYEAEAFDAVVLDAPCSATGTIRRHPDLPLVRRGEEIGGLIELQAAMLDRALMLLKPGGRAIYCTCSLLPDEGECQVDAALVRHPGVVVDPEAFNLPGVDVAWRTEEGGLRLRPDYLAERGGMDGFYMCSLRRR